MGTAGLATFTNNQLIFDSGMVWGKSGTDGVVDSGTDSGTDASGTADSGTTDSGTGDSNTAGSESGTDSGTGDSNTAGLESGGSTDAYGNGTGYVQGDPHVRIQLPGEQPLCYDIEAEIMDFVSLIDDEGIDLRSMAVLNTSKRLK